MGFSLSRSLQRPVTVDSCPRTSWARSAVELTLDLALSLPVTGERGTRSAGDSPWASPLPPKVNEVQDPPSRARTPDSDTPRNNY